LRKNIIAILLLFLIFLSSCKNIQQSLPNVESNYSYETLCEEINTDEFYVDFFKNPLIGVSEEAKRSLNDINNEYMYLSYIGEIFPDALIQMFQESLYNFVEYNPRTITLTDSYFELLKYLGSENFIMSEEERNASDIKNPERCINAFKFNSNENSEKGLFVYDSDSSSGQSVVEFKEYKNGELNTISQFYTQNNGFGRVIEYENDFYYVFLQYNYNLKNYDSIKLHRLGVNATEEHITIRRIPKSYVLKNIYYASNENIDAYTNSIEKAIISQYIENGSVRNDISCLMGDEREYQNFYETDFTNKGIPVFFQKNTYLPSNYSTTMQLKVKFFLQDLKDNIFEMEKLEMSNVSEFSNELIQLWFKEIDGKIYTFQIYHLFDYNYMLNVMLVEGNEITQIRKDLLLPKLEFKMENIH